MNKPTLLLRGFKIAFASVGLLFAGQAAAMDITVKASVIMPPCTVNQGNVLEIDFGDAVIIPQIDGQNFRKTVPYTIECNASAPDALKLQISGVGAAFNQNLLNTDQSGLGIVFYQNAQPLPINTKINVSYLALPTIEAAPMKQANASLTAGAFSAAATLGIYYD